MPMQTNNKLRSEVLLELLGNPRPDPHRQTSATHRGALPNVGVQLSEISEPIQRAWIPTKKTCF